LTGVAALNFSPGPPARSDEMNPPSLAGNTNSYSLPSFRPRISPLKIHTLIPTFP
jgi:hypothetical protein